MYYALVSLTAASLAVTCTDATWIFSMFFGKIFARTLRVKHLVPQGLEWMTTIPTAVNKPVTIEKLALLILSVVSLSYDSRPEKTFPPSSFQFKFAVCGISSLLHLARGRLELLGVRGFSAFHITIAAFEINLILRGVPAD